MTKSPSHIDHNPRIGIGILNEFSLHAEIIQHLALSNDILEAKLEGYYIDILRDRQIIEIQTAHLAKLQPKIKKLRDSHTIEIIYPIQVKKTIIRKNSEGEIVSKRKSPKTGRIEHLFDELVYAPKLIEHKNVSLTTLMIEAEEIWMDDGKGSWRRKYWSISERHLSQVIQKSHFKDHEDFLQLLPKSLPSPFTNKQLAEQLRIRGRLAGKITYTLRKMGILQIVDKKGNAYLFSTT